MPAQRLVVERLEALDARRRRQAQRRAQSLSVSVTEAVFANSTTARLISQHLQVFFGDSNAEYALRKALICDIEDRLEWLYSADSLSQAHSLPATLASFSPLDEAILTALDGLGEVRPAVEIRRQTYRWPAFVQFLRRFRRAIVSFGGLFLQPAAGGVTWRTPRQRLSYRIATSNKWGVGWLSPVRSDLFIVDGRRITISDIVVLLRREYFPSGNTPEKYRALGVPCTDPNSWAMPVAHLIRRLCPRFLRLNVALLFAPESSPLDGYFKDIALRLARMSLPWEAFMQHYRVDWLFDNEEYTPQHIIQTLVLNRYGARTLRLPHSMMDLPGKVLAYVHYNVFTSTSDYVAREYGGTWSPATLCVPVGQIFNDVLRTPENLPGSPKTKALLHQLQLTGQRILLVLTDSFVPPSQENNLRVIRVALAVAEARDNVAVVVKPKGGTYYFLKQPPYRELLYSNGHSDWVFVLTPEDGYGVTETYSDPLQLILPYATVCMITVGSTIFETLAAGVPIFALADEFAHCTSLSARLRGVVAFETEAGLRKAVEQVLDEGRWSPPDLSDLLLLADPFRDGGAIERIRRIVLNGQPNE